MHPAVKSSIIAAARANPLQEVCGFIVIDSANEAQVMECRNTAANPSSDWRIGQEDHIRALRLGPGRILGIYHSHPNEPGFSPADLDNAAAQALPFYLYCVTADTWHEYIPATYRPPLEGRPFVLGHQDCYEQIRLHFRAKHAHHMGDYDRDRTLNLKDLILSRFEVEGFRRVDLADIQMDDVLMFESDRLLSNHFGVLVGPSTMLHHPLNGLSAKETISDRWLSRLVCVFRWRGPGPN